MRFVFLDVPFVFFFFFWLPGAHMKPSILLLSDKETEAAYAIRHLRAGWRDVIQSSYTPTMSSTLTFWLNKARRRERDRSNQRKGQHWHLQLSPKGPPLPYYLIGPRQQCGFNHRPGTSDRGEGDGRVHVGDLALDMSLVPPPPFFFNLFYFIFFIPLEPFPCPWMGIPLVSKLLLY